jgi:Tfp pilus assembly protein PilO
MKMFDVKSLMLQGNNSLMATAGVYVIVILAVTRFLIYPFHASLDNRRSALNDQRGRNHLKTRLLEKARQGQCEDGSQDALRMLTALYPREAPISKIQTDVLAMVSEWSESRGITVTGFEMLESISGKKIMEVPVIVRLKGRAEPLLDLLKMIRKHEKILMIRGMEISSTGQELTVSLTMKALRWQ